MTRCGQRLGGVCAGACDSDEYARLAYATTFPDSGEPLSNLSMMGTDPRVARQAHIIFCGFCCKPFVLTLTVTPHHIFGPLLGVKHFVLFR